MNDLYLNILHAHKWGSPWTDHLKIIPLSKNQQRILHDACEVLQTTTLKCDEFINVWNEVEEYIKSIGSVFFKLSSVSPKDVIIKERPNQTLKATHVDEVFEVFVRSFRVMEELEGSDDYALILTKWNDDINIDDEYRCFVMNGICEAIAKKTDEKEVPSKEITMIIHQYISDHIETFPDKTLAIDISIKNEKVIFIEFNPVDEELDCFGIMERDDVRLSQQAIDLLKRESGHG